MPQVIPWAVQAIGTALTGTALAAGTVSVISAAVYALGSLALSNYQKKKAEQSARAQFDAAQVDRMVNVQTTVMPRELVMGRVRKGGAIFFRAGMPPVSSTFVCCVALAAHEIDGVERIFFNDQPIDLDAQGNVTTAPWGRYFSESDRLQMTGTSVALGHAPIAGSVTVIRSKNVYQDSAEWEYVPHTLSGLNVTIDSFDPSSQYEVRYQWTNFLSFARVFVHNGSPSQTANARLQLFFPGVWTAAHRAAGVAYLECEFVYEESAFPSGLPAVTALLRGAKVYDPRTGTTAFSENPALMQRHVLMHSQFGKRASLSAAEDARIAAAANACEIGLNSVSYTHLTLPTKA